MNPLRNEGGHLGRSAFEEMRDILLQCRIWSYPNQLCYSDRVFTEMIHLRRSLLLQQPWQMFWGGQSRQHLLRNIDQHMKWGNRSNSLAWCPAVSRTGVGLSTIRVSSYIRYEEIIIVFPQPSLLPVLFEWISHSLWWILELPQMWMVAEERVQRMSLISLTILSTIAIPSS